MEAIRRLPPDWSQIRKRFPAVERFTYLNTAGGGPMCASAMEEAQRYLEEANRYGDGKWDEWVERSEGVRRHLAKVLNATPEEIAFLSNASFGINTLAEMFGGDGEVVTAADDFPSVTLPWLRRGYPVKFLQSGSSGAPDYKEIEDALGPGTRYLVISFVQFATGFRYDLARLGEICRAREMLLVVDATQGFGAFPIDVQRGPIDALVFSCYKWTTAGYGIAPLYVRRELLESRTLPQVGWRSARVPYDLVSTRLDLTSEARGLELGHMPFAGVFALGGALRFLEEIGPHHIEARVHDLTEELHARMEGLGVEVLSPRDRERRSGITVLKVPEPKRVATQLQEKNILVAARRNGLRVALHFYNDKEDIDRFTGAMTDILNEG